MLLSGTHVLFVTGDAARRGQVTAFLQGLAAIVHSADSQFAAIGMLVELAKRDIVPRVVVVDWLLHPLSSQEYAFYRRIGRVASATSLHLLEHLRTIDAEVPIVICADADCHPSAEVVSACGNARVIRRDDVFDETAVGGMLLPGNPAPTRRFGDTPPPPTRVANERSQVIAEEASRLNQAVG